MVTKAGARFKGNVLPCDPEFTIDPDCVTGVLARTVPPKLVVEDEEALFPAEAGVIDDEAAAPKLFMDTSCATPEGESAAAG